MSSMDPNRKSRSDFKQESISAILEACSKTGVTSLKWRDLEVSFHVPGQPVIAYDLPKTTNDGYAPQASGHELTVDKNLSTVNRELLEDMEASQLMIDDPIAFEQLMIDAQLRQARHVQEKLNDS